ncbi:MAG: hypothetical protein Q9213_007080 [Squamulea squamosa]
MFAFPAYHPILRLPRRQVVSPNRTTTSATHSSPNDFSTTQSSTPNSFNDFLSQTNSLGVITGQPTAVTTQPGVIVSQPDGASGVTGEPTFVTSQPNGVSVVTGQPTVIISQPTVVNTQAAVGTTDTAQLTEKVTTQPSTLPGSSRDGRPLDLPPAYYPYGKTASRLEPEGSPGPISDSPSNIKNQNESQSASADTSRGSTADFYAQSSKHERHDPDIISYLDRPEIDGSPLVEAPESPEQPGASKLNVSTRSKRSPQVSDKDMDLDHLSKLEQEERRLQEDIAQIERLERLKAERDKVQQRITELSQQPK